MISINQMTSERTRMLVGVLVMGFLGVARGQAVYDLRLEGGEVNSGRLEIFYNGEWGTICDDGFGLPEAEVACRQLGLDSSYVDYYQNAHFGEGAGPVWLDNVECRGYESFLWTCTHRGFSTHDCSHLEDVGISCGRSEAVDDVQTGSGGGVYFSSVGSWIGFVVAFIVILVAITAYRRRRLYRQQQQLRTTTVIQPPTTTTIQVANTRDNTNMPTYVHGPPPQPASRGPPSYPAVTQPYPTGAQPYPVAGNAAGFAYPPQAQTGSNMNPSTENRPYPVQPTTAYPPTPAPSQPGIMAGMPYPPQHGQHSIYPPSTGVEPPPPSYDDAVKQ